mmetsp:Transcript_10253/g.30008  ORF Transcript_10253/g.30008 Transcript_10253/m.30008 type:complete len:218 (-) Transcript_10253:312-965(-)
MRWQPQSVRSRLRRACVGAGDGGAQGEEGPRVAQGLQEGLVPHRVPQHAFLHRHRGGVRFGQGARRAPRSRGPQIPARVARGLSEQGGVEGEQAPRHRHYPRREMARVSDGGAGGGGGVVGGGPDGVSPFGARRRPTLDRAAARARGGGGGGGAGRAPPCGPPPLWRSVQAEVSRPGERRRAEPRLAAARSGRRLWSTAAAAGARAPPLARSASSAA